MKIGIVCYPTFGGSGIVATELGHVLAQKGHEVHFITYDQPVRLDIMDKNIYYHEVNVHVYPLFDYQPYELALSSQMVDTVMSRKLDVLHVHYAIPHAYAAFMAKQILKDRGIDIAVVTTLHGTDITLVGKQPSYLPAVKFSIEHSDYVTAVSDSLKEDTITNFTTNKEIHVVPNFIDISLYSGDRKCSGQIAEPGEMVISHISNFRPLKRTKDVIKVFAGIREKLPAKLVLMGDGPERDITMQMARELGILDDVKYLGKTNDVERVLCMTDLFLLPSSSESFGLAALEAMAAKVPVISTNTGGIPEVNIQGVTGFLSNVGDVDEMIENSLKILTNPELKAKMSRNAYARAEEFDIHKIVPMYEEIYEEVTKGNG
ncbi:N-acetyl-alpha-D-glucosaminyl L-malate synthase BshA [bacterium SCSIO 12643]|nr:N-acetyl-alpha-D-glucosaminyl L-malate synthase BshA [bacterium SCSIO 12643]